MRLSTSQPLILLIAASSNGSTLPFNCAPDNDTMTTPSFGTTDAVFTACSQITINSSPSAVYEALLDFPRYPDWNTFVYSVELPSNVSSAKDVYIGMPMTFHSSGLLPGINSTSDERITFLEPDVVPPFAAWRYDEGALVGLLMNAEHVTVLEDLGDGTTNCVSWETYYGAGALLTLTLKANLQTEFQNEVSDLKGRVEALAT
ncbi:hypothetical protein LOCC1_G007833 [Lachnellula occidentalis]|uniref:Coenzyme Q-binding protein COQ10 START domain-containing protein n=1 Tax=Lachnellula occidentalis TaxID=215460 RepID=A0A8H8RL90_9HELO|nr:hypothetical protein LOCC1_G007833 [Lachnellula occidentalis]